MSKVIVMIAFIVLGAAQGFAEEAKGKEESQVYKTFKAREDCIVNLAERLQRERKKTGSKVYFMEEMEACGFFYKEVKKPSYRPNHGYRKPAIKGLK